MSEVCVVKDLVITWLDLCRRAQAMKTAKNWQLLTFYSTRILYVHRFWFEYFIFSFRFNWTFDN